jgi:hypothetical protein
LFDTEEGRGEYAVLPWEAGNPESLQKYQEDTIWDERLKDPLGRTQEQIRLEESGLGTRWNRDLAERRIAEGREPWSFAGNLAAALDERGKMTPGRGV